MLFAVISVRPGSEWWLCESGDVELCLLCHVLKNVCQETVQCDDALCVWVGSYVLRSGGVRSESEWWVHDRSDVEL